MKVRESGALGQILPCPKCGSMVLVHAPSPTDSDSNRTSEDGLLTSSADRAAVAGPLIRNGFEQIDQLLDGEPVPTPTPIPSPRPETSASRWKQSPDTADPSGAGRKTAAERPTLGESEGSVAATPEAIPVDDRAQARPMEPTDVVVRGAEWIPRSVGVARRFAMIAGGTLVGTALAVGMTAWVLMRPADPPAEVAASSIPTADVPAPAKTRLDSEESPAEPAPRVIPTTPEEQEPDGSTAASSTAQNLEDPGAAAPVEPERSGASLAAGDVAPVAEIDPSDPSDDVPPPLPVPVDSVPDRDPVEQPDSVDVPDDPAPVPVGVEDELAGFARWLSTASADPTQAPTSPVLEPTGPVVDPIPRPMQPSRPVPPAVDVASRLQDPVAAIEFREVALVDALRDLSDLSTIPITIDPDALARRMLSPRQTVSLLRTNTTAERLLQEILEPLRLAYVISEGHLLVTTELAARGEPITVSHDVSDLAEDRPERAAELGAWLTQMVAVGSWQDHGGNGSYRVDGTTLVVEQSDTLQYQILLFCERLRHARGLPRRSRIPELVVQFEPVVQRMRALQEPLTIRIWQERNLNQLASALEREANITVLLDWQSLLMAGWSPEDQTRLFCHEQPLGAVLQDLLDPMGLTFRVIDAETLQITSPEAAAAVNDVEFYRLPAERQSAEQVQQLSGQLVQRIGPAWFQPAGSGAIAYDLASQTLIVALPQLAQPAVAELLDAPQN